MHLLNERIHLCIKLLPKNFGLKQSLAPRRLVLDNSATLISKRIKAERRQA
jgi:hypothetical protein